MSDLQVFPVSLPGGINQSAPLPAEGDLEELLNFGIFRNRVGLRAPLQLVATLQDDQGTPANVTSILDITDHEGNLYVASHSTITDKVYLHSMQVDGTSVTLEAVLWSGVVNRPTVILTSFEGGAADTGVSRLYASDYNQNLATVYWNGASVTTLTEDLDNDNTAESIYFSIMIPYKFHLWGTGFFESGTLRPEMARFTQPGAIPATDDGGGLNPKEWHSADHRSVGRRGDKIVAAALAGDRLILFQKRATHAVYGSGSTTWTRQELSNVVGCVGPHAVASVDERVAYFWASDGPYRTDGSQLQYIGDPIRQFAVETDADEYETRVAYSPDDGLVYFVVSPGGEDSYHYVFVFDHRRERWMRSIWLDGSAGQVEFGAFTAMDSAAAPGPEAAPSTVAATAVGSGQINLTWVNGDVNVNTVTHIYRSTSSGFTPNDATNRIGVVGAGTTTYEDTDSLSANTAYYYKIQHYRNSAHSSESNQATATTWLAPPTALGLAGLTAGLRVTGTNPVSGGDVVIQRRVSGGSFATITTLSDPGGSFSHDATSGITCGVTYYYRAKTQLGGATDSEWSATVSRAGCEATTAPTAPSSLTLGAVGETSIAMSWTDNSDNEDEFQVWRSTDEGVTFTLHASLAAATTSYTDTSLTSYTTYHYEVRAVNSAGSSTFSNEISATTDPNLTTPSDLAAVADSTSQITLTWTDGAGDETSWQIFRDGVLRDTIAANSSTYVDTGLSESTLFEYTVRPAVGTTVGSHSNTASATTASGNSPDAPTLLTATVNGGSPTTTIDLAWTDNADDESEYEVWRSAEGAAFVLIATIAANSTSYQDTSCNAGTAYTYYVRACNGFGCRPSNQDSASTTGSASPPSAPSALTGTDDTADLGAEVEAIDLTWTPGSSNEESFTLERKLTGASIFFEIASIPAGETSYRDESVTANATTSRSYDYRIKAVNSAGESAYSATETVAVEPKVTPSSVTATDDTYCNGAIATPRVAVTWSQGDVTGLETRTLQRSVQGSGAWSTVTSWSSSPSSQTSYSDTSVSFGIYYIYRVVDDHGSTGENTGTFTSSASDAVTCIVIDCGGPE